MMPKIWTAKRQKVEESPLLDVKKECLAHCSFESLLPAPLVTGILEFCDFATLVNVGSCNMALNRFVYEESNTNFWRVLDFATVKEEWSSQITDQQLDALLRKINAREKCISIKLTGCCCIQGRGLEPLKGTCKLKDIDLRLVHPRRSEEYEHREVDPEQILPILSSMAPFPQRNQETGNDHAPAKSPNSALGLLSVKFHAIDRTKEVLYERYSERIGNWLREFDEVLGARAIELRTPCDFCRTVIADLHPSDQMHWPVASGYCGLCFRLSCCDNNQCPSVISCDDCDLQCCQEDTPGEQEPCTKYDYVMRCENSDCRAHSCVECDTVGFMCENHGCIASYCSECVDSFMDECPHCEKTEDLYCKDCFIEHEKTCNENPSIKRCDCSHP